MITKSSQEKTLLKKQIREIKTWTKLSDSLQKKELKKLLKQLESKRDFEANSKEGLYIDSFTNPLEFGTGGLRGVFGQGAGRLNDYTISITAKAFIQCLKEDKKAKGKDLLIIAADSRKNSDRYLLLTAYQAYLQGFEVMVFPIPTPTPLLSYAIRTYKAKGGVVITASHNPPEYNGFKAYLSGGEQIIPPYDTKIAKKINQFKHPEKVKLPLKLKSFNKIKFPLKSSSIPFPVKIIGENLFESYKHDLANSIGKTALLGNKQTKNKLIKNIKKLNIAYSPIHGTGGAYMPDLLFSAGFKNVAVVKSQKKPDPLFPTVIYPNPEEEDAMKEVKKLAIKNKADLCFATDPDSDRLGLGAKFKNGEYKLFNGNQIGAMLLHYLIEKNLLKKNKSKVKVCKTIVTSELQSKIAIKNKISLTNVLTGFKYIAEEMKKIDLHNAVHPEKQWKFLFGGEESYGYLPVDFVRDKDALSSALLLCYIAAEKGNLWDYLESIHKEYGFHKDELFSITLKGSRGMKLIQKTMRELRKLVKSKNNNKNKNFFSKKIIAFADFQENTFKGDLSKTQVAEFRKLPKSNVLQFFLEDDCKVTVRPSGTEPKIKFYFNYAMPLQNSQSFKKQEEILNKGIKRAKLALSSLVKELAK